MKVSDKLSRMKDPDLSVVRTSKLQNKSNFLAFRRTFDRIAKSMDVWNMLIDNEIITTIEPTEPENYANKTHKGQSHAQPPRRRRQLIILVLLFGLPLCR